MTVALRVRKTKHDQKRYANIRPKEEHLRTLATETAGELDILGLDGNTLGMDGAV